MVEYFIHNEPQYAHERQSIVTLAQLMRRAFGASERFYMLAANVHLWQAQADAIIFMPHAIVLIELKACGDPIYGRPQGAWRLIARGEQLPILAGSHTNPYEQVTATRQTLIKYLDRNRQRFLSDSRAREMDGQWGQVSAAIVFSPHLHQASDIITPPESQAWLGVIGLNEAAEFLFSRYSPHFDFSPQELRRMAAEALGCQPWGELEQVLLPGPANGHLWVLDEAGQPMYAFPIFGEVSLGRSRDNSLVIPHRFNRTSRHHARLSLEGDEVWLQDDGSTHGTFINRQTVTPGQRRILQKGDLITLGDIGQPGACCLRFERLPLASSVTSSTMATDSFTSEP